MDFQELAKQRYSVRRYASEAVGAVALWRRRCALPRPTISSPSAFLC